MFIRSFVFNKKIFILIFAFVLIFLLSCSFLIFFSFSHADEDPEASDENSEDFIKWVDFKVTSEAMKLTSSLDIKSHNNSESVIYNWIELLAYLACKNGGDFKNFKSSDLDKLVSELNNGKSIQELTSSMKYYSYYLEAYSAVLGGFIGNYSIDISESSDKTTSDINSSDSSSSGSSSSGSSSSDSGSSDSGSSDSGSSDSGSSDSGSSDSGSSDSGSSDSGSSDSGSSDSGSSDSNFSGISSSDTASFENKYGLKAFLPIAKNYNFSHYDDFGNSRSYGFKRTHLGNDLMGSIGTPIIAVESGTVEHLGWNQYGGWRIGIRSFDGKRYYYYAHLRKNHPYVPDLKEGATVTAGDVIGYLGMTGYSIKENVNNINVPHLHFGMQLIFDESQVDSPNEIWIDVYEIIEFLKQNRSEVILSNSDTRDYSRKIKFQDSINFE